MIKWILMSTMKVNIRRTIFSTLPRYQLFIGLSVATVVFIGVFTYNFLVTEQVLTSESERATCPNFPINAINRHQHPISTSSKTNPSYFLFDPHRQCNPATLLPSLFNDSQFDDSQFDDSQGRFSTDVMIETLPWWKRMLRSGQPHRWYTRQENYLTLGFVPHDTWFLKAFELPDHHDGNATVSISNPLLDYVDIWIYQSNGQLIRAFSVGDHRPFDQRPVKDTNFILPIRLPLEAEKNTTIWVLLRVKTNENMQFNLDFHIGHDYLESSNYFKLHQGLYIGVVLAMLLYNIVLTVRLSDQEYYIYAAWVPCVAMVVIANNGLGFHYLWPNAMEWNNYAPQFFGELSAMFGGFFCLCTLRVFRNVPSPLPQTLFVFSVLAGFFAFVCLMRWIPAGLSLQIAHVITSMIIGLIITSSIVCVSKGVLLSKSYLLAWSTVSVGGVLTVLEHFGALSNVLTQHALQVGSTLEILLMSILLSARVHEEKQQTLVIQKNMNRELEEKVAERTRELDALNQQLSVLSVTDGLIGLNNRRHFDESFAQMFHFAQRVKGSLHLLMIDIDHFKKINDTCGHAFGDTCLKRVAQTLKNHCKRTSDVVARYGGEEFAVILSNTQDADAERLANNIRLSLLQSSLTFKDKNIPLTCSIGISANLATDVEETQLLIRADQMLYQAKQSGRNCVKISLTHTSPVAQKNIAV